MTSEDAVSSLAVKGMGGDGIACIRLLEGECCRDAKRKIFEACGRRVGQQQLLAPGGRILTDEDSLEGLAELTLVVPNYETDDPRVLKEEPSDKALVCELLKYFDGAPVQVKGVKCDDDYNEFDVLLDIHMNTKKADAGLVLSNTCVLPLSKDHLRRAVPWNAVGVRTEDVGAVLALTGAWANGMFHADIGGRMDMVLLLDMGDGRHELLAASLYTFANE
eukprot:TRINITY_DN112883_c0_g1_i1.p1 TRINITY_DN112883_c0_g1~~TRINITY_DN112883_c0_g1_i1.p1  ORF type:complete len:220 (+),score=45.83 TRINITY_DN112883_c0_g1_i1:102-761(+)